MDNGPASKQSKYHIRTMAAAELISAEIRQPERFTSPGSVNPQPGQKTSLSSRSR